MLLQPPLAAASDNHRQVPTWPTYDVIGWLTQNTDCCFDVIGLVQDIPQSFALHIKTDPVSLPSLLASSSGQRIFIYIHGEYGMQKNIYKHA